jgi:hypothetical protein
MGENNEQKSTSRIDSDSIFYNRVVPALLVGLGIVMLMLIIFAIGVLLGFVPYR